MILSIGLCLTHWKRNFRTDSTPQAGEKGQLREETGRGSWGGEGGLRQWLLCHLPAWGWFPQDPLSLLNYKEVKEA